MSQQPSALPGSAFAADSPRPQLVPASPPGERQAFLSPLSAEEILARLEDAIAVSTTDLDTILHWIAQAAQKFTGADGVALAVRREGSVVCCGRSGEMAPGLGARLSVDSGFSGACLLSARTLRCDDAWQDTRVDAEVCRGMGLRSIAGAPLMGRYGVMGLLEAFSSQPGAFTDEHLSFLDRLAALAEHTRARGSAPTVVDTEVPESLPAEAVHASDVASAAGQRRWTRRIVLVLPGMLVVALLSWLLLQRRAPQAAANPPVAAAEPVPIPASATETSTPLAFKPSAARLKNQPTNGASLPAASQRSVEGAPMKVVSADQLMPVAPRPGASSPAPAEAGNSNVEPPDVASTGSVPLALAPSVTPMPTLDQPVSNLTPGVLIHRVQPNYPVQALPMGLHGAVVLKAMVGEDGKVRNIKVVSGHPMLAQAARDAVGQWLYDPFKLNGKPVPMETQITVNFAIPPR